MIPQTPTVPFYKKTVSKAVETVLAKLSGAAVPFVQYDDDGNLGAFGQPEFYQDGSTNIGTLQARCADVLSDLIDAGAEAAMHFALVKVFGRSGHREDDDTGLYQAKRASLSTMTARMRKKRLAEFGAAPVVARLSEGGGFYVEMQLPLSRSIGNLASNLGVYVTQEGPGREAFFESLKSTGYRPGVQSGKVTFDLREVASGEFFSTKKVEVIEGSGKNKTVSKVFEKPLAGMKQLSFTLHVRSVKKGPSVLVNPVTHQEFTFSDESDVPPNLLGRYWSHYSKTDELQFTVGMYLSPDEARYVVQSEEPSLLHVGEWATNAFRQSAEIGWYPTFITPVPHALNKVKSITASRPLKSRTGHLGLMIKPSSLLFYDIPETDNGVFDNTAAVEEFQTEWHVHEGDYLSDPHPPRNDPDYDKNLPAYREDVVAVDWVTNILTLSGSGRVHYQDIAGWGAATPWQIKRFIYAPIRGDVAKAMGTALLRWSCRYATARGLIDFSQLKGDKWQVSRLSAPDGWWNAVYYLVQEDISRLTPEQKEEVGAVTTNEALLQMMKLNHLNSQCPIPTLAFLSQAIAKTADEVLSGRVSFPEVCSAVSLTVDYCLRFKAMLKIWNAYCRKPGGLQKLEAEDVEYRSCYGSQPEDQDELPEGFTPDAVPNVKESDTGLMYMPHQSKAAYSLQKRPKLALLDIAAGGGKTIIILTDVLRRLDNKTCDLPAVFCPSHLLSNYVEDGNYSTDGKLNIIPLNSDTVERFGREYFEKIAQSGPRNKVFIIDYDYLKWGESWVSYGATLETWCDNAQWVRSLGIDAAWFDESHYLKNTSQRSDAVLQAIVDIPLRVLATGTMLATRQEDVINQMLVLDPGVFGTQEKFQDLYGDSKTIEDWETGKQVSTKAWLALTMQKNICHIKGRRKEWAALLPPKRTKFYWAPLTENQRKVYQSILEATLDEIMKDEKLVEIMNQGDENAMDNMEAMLRRYLQRIEKFLAAPAVDELAKVLKGDDLVSPKGKIIGEIVKEHRKKNIPGKILVFTSYIDSAKEVLAALPPEIRKHFMLYTAERKMQCREQFKNDDNIWGMIGVENSMNTGINAQYCSRLIRVESIYSPGILEQGEARVYRPNIKDDEFRDMIYTDWVLVDKTIDVTKAGRLMWRSIDAAKFYNAESPIYQSLPDLDPIRMTIDSLMANNSFNETIGEYQQAYMQLENEIIAEEIAEYKARHPELDYVKVKSKGNLKGSALLKNLPYIPGGNIYSQSDLGLVAVPEFAREGALVDEDFDMKGMAVHTDMGDGYIKRVLKDSLNVVVGNETYRIDKDAAFIITKQTTSAKEIRNALAGVVGLPIVHETPGIKNADAPAKVIQEPVVDSPVPDSYEDEEHNPEGLAVWPGYYNDFFSLTIGDDEVPDEVSKDLRDLGFKEFRSCYWIQLKKPDQAHALIAALADRRRKLIVDDKFLDQLQYAEQALKRGLTHFSRFKRLMQSRHDYQLLHTMRNRKAAPGQVRMFMTLVDGNLFVLADHQNMPDAWPRVHSISIPGCKWQVDAPYFCYLSTSRQDVARVAKELATRHKVANVPWVKEQLKAMTDATRKQELELE